MGRFSDEKRAYVREQLLETGRALFARYGLEKTTIADLTEAVGIAHGTFYQFFDSKERLYLEILQQEQEEYVERASEVLADADTPESAIVAYLDLATGEIETNPLVHQLVVDDDWRRLLEQLSDEERARQHERELRPLLPYIREWQDDGLVVDAEPEVVADSINAVLLVALHREDIEGNYGAIRDLLVRSVAAGLTADAKPAE